jgi:hypothetical protein
MSPAGATLVSIDDASASTDEVSWLIPQPERPRLPIRVPVLAELGGTFMPADVLGSTNSVLLLQGSEQRAALPPLGTPVRLRMEWDRQVLTGRLAAYGVAGRFLVSMGERPIRRSRRFNVDLPGVARGLYLQSAVPVRIADLSTGGARVAGIELPVGSEVELRFAPPGRPSALTVLGFVVRKVEAADAPALGIAFRLAQPSMDLLTGAALAA